MADGPECAGGTDERAVEERVERIIVDLKANRVVPSQGKRLAEATRRWTVDRSVDHATGSTHRSDGSFR